MTNANRPAAVAIRRPTHAWGRRSWWSRKTDGGSLSPVGERLSRVGKAPPESGRGFFEWGEAFPEWGNVSPSGEGPFPSGGTPPQVGKSLPHLGRGFPCSFERSPSVGSGNLKTGLITSGDDPDTPAEDEPACTLPALAPSRARGQPPRRPVFPRVFRSDGLEGIRRPATRRHLAPVAGRRFVSRALPGDPGQRNRSGPGDTGRGDGNRHGARRDAGAGSPDTGGCEALRGDQEIAEGFLQREQDLDRRTAGATPS